MLSVKLDIEKNILSRENKPQNFAKFELLYNKPNIQEQIINWYKTEVWHFCLLEQMLVIREVVGLKRELRQPRMLCCHLFATRFAVCTGGFWLTFINHFY